MDKQPGAFFGIWLICVTLTISVAATFNLMMDPRLLFDTPQFERINARKAFDNGDERLIKAYDVLRAAPRALILGTSVADFGLDARLPIWPHKDRPVYNLALAGGCDPYTSYMYVQHVMSRHRPSLIVLALDFETFLVRSWGYCMDRETQARLVLTPNGTRNLDRNRQEVRDVMHATFSLDVLIQSIRTLAGNLYGDLPAFVSGNFPDTIMQYFTAPKGFYPFAIRDLFQVRSMLGAKYNPNIMPQVVNLLALCNANGIRLVILINPAHADMLELTDLLGHWGTFEAWKRELVALTAIFNDKNGRTELWDFSGYNQYSTETLPPAGHTMRWFYDTNHYTHELGNLVLRRLFGADLPGFGILLTPENLEAHLRTIREERENYRQGNPDDVQRARAFYYAVAGTPSHKSQRLSKAGVRMQETSTEAHSH